MGRPIYKNGNSYGGYYTGPAFDVVFNKGDSGMQSENVQDAILELWKYVNGHNTMLNPTVFSIPDNNSLTELKLFLVELAKAGNFCVFNLTNTQSLFGKESNLICTMISDGKGNYSLYMKDNLSTDTYVGVFQNYLNDNSDYTLEVYKCNVDSQNIFESTNA